MNIARLFHVIVVGCALLGGASCESDGRSPPPPTDAPPAPDTSTDRKSTRLNSSDMSIASAPGPSTLYLPDALPMSPSRSSGWTGTARLRETDQAGGLL